MKLNTAILLTISFALIPSAASGQINNFSIGPRVGINIANVSNIDNSKSLVGPVVGITSTYSFSETSGITLDILYSGNVRLSAGIAFGLSN